MQIHFETHSDPEYEICPLQVFCLCPEGYKLQDDWKTCRPDNACLEGNGGCDQICIHRPATAARGGGHECACHAGFRMDSKVGNSNRGMTK